MMKLHRAITALASIISVSITGCGSDSSPANEGAAGSIATASSGGSAVSTTGGATSAETKTGGAGGASLSAGGATTPLSQGGSAQGGTVVQTATGGAASGTAGGAPASGGTSSTGTGGRVNSLGGAAAMGGSKATGGATAGGNKATGGAAAAGGSKATGGASAAGGTMSTGGAAAVGGRSAAVGGSSTGGATSGTNLARFSFFVTSQVAMTQRAGSSNGFGGDLRYGQADGLAGADKICTEIAEASMPGSGAKGWRAFLSVTAGADGRPVNAIDRVGPGPWYDRLGRVVALTKADLANPRPLGADPAILNDLPNETGTPNHAPNGTAVDNHDTLTGSNAQGQIGSTTRANTCNDWTSSVGTTGRPQIGHSWPRGTNNAVNWIADHTAPGCGAGVNTGSQNGSGTCVGCSGGYGGIYCFALTP